MSLKHAILGFLSREPLSGYDLKKNFDNSVRHFWKADQSQIYRALSQLADQGLVRIERIPREERLDVKLYHLTDAGEQELCRWLASAPEQDTREPLLIHIFFGSLLEDADMLRLLENRLQESEAALVAYESMYRSMLPRLEDLPDKRLGFFRMLTLEYGLRANRAEHEWLQSVIVRIQAGAYTPADLAGSLGGDTPDD